ncbi:MAG: hypothetical protein R3338_11680 [Thermoanaerobaculia bacterium]|nr:hypothetical protein [Thermoanaerobaculia bacterium]
MEGFEMRARIAEERAEVIRRILTRPEEIPSETQEVESCEESN